MGESLDIRGLAEVAHFSPFHFHRLFSAWMGESVGDYVRRRRLESAAYRLVVQPTSSVLDIALTVGFGSAEAFARAFKDRFGCAPTAWRLRRTRHRRQDSNPGQVDSKNDQVSLAALGNHASASSREAHRPVNVHLIDRQPVDVAYLRYVGPFDESIVRFWETAVVPWLTTNRLLDKPKYGITCDVPSVVAPSQCRYDACVEVAPDFLPNGGALTTTIPGGRYATLEFDGKVADIGEAWTALLRDWLPSSGLQLDNRPMFEYQPPDGRYDASTGTISCEVCIPIAPL